MALLTRTRNLQESIYSISNSLSVEGMITDISVSLKALPSPSQQKKVTFITEPIEIESRKLKNKNKKKLAAAVAASAARSRPNMEAYDNSLFQFDDDSSILKTAGYLSRIGKKGRDAGYLGDASDVKYIGNNVILVTDMSNNRLQTFDIDCGKVLNVCELEKDSSPICAIMTQDNQVAVTSRLQKCVLILSKEGEVVKAVGQGNYQWPFGIAQDPQSCRIAVTDQSNHSVTLLDENFNQILKIDNKNSNDSLLKPKHVTFSEKGHIVVSDSGNHSVKVFDQNGTIVTSFGKFGRGVGEFRAPYGVCSDQYGDILVADHYNDRVSCFDIRGHWQQDLICYYHGLRHPQGIALSSGNKLCASHGGMKATEIAVYDLLSLQEESQDTRL